MKFVVFPLVDHRLSEACKRFDYNRSEFYSPPGRVETGFDGTPWLSLDMANDLFCATDAHAIPGAQLSSLLVSMQRLGGTVGTIIAGFLSNRLGRKRSIQAIIVANCVFLIALIFANEPAPYGICLALCEVCSGFVLTVVSTYGIEVIGPKWRVYFGAFTTAAYGIGFILVTILAMFLPDRQVLTVAVASIYALNFVYMRAIPESPIWALTTDRMKLARKSIATLSSQLSVDGQSQVDVYIRRLSISSQRRSSLASECDLEQVKEPDWRTKVANSNLGRLFKGRLIRKFTLLTVAMHTCVSIADYGSKYFAAKLPGNIYYNNVFTGLSEFIGSMVTFPLIRRFGLKNTSLGLNLAAGCLMLLTMGR